MGNGDISLPTYSMPPQHVADVPIVDIEFTSTQTTVVPANNNPMVYVIDQFSTAGTPRLAMDLPHGFLTLINLLTMDLNHDGVADVPVSNTIGIATRLDDASSIYENLDHIFSTPQPTGLVNLSMGQPGFPLPLLYWDILPLRMRPVKKQDDYVDFALKPHEAERLRMRLSKVEGLVNHSLNKKKSPIRLINTTLMQTMERLSTQYSFFQAGGNERVAENDKHKKINIKGYTQFSPAWLSSALVAVGGLDANGNLDDESAYANDVGAPFEARFSLEVFADETGKPQIRWTNQLSGLSVVTGFIVPLETVYAVSINHTASNQPMVFNYGYNVQNRDPREAHITTNDNGVFLEDSAGLTPVTPLYPYDYVDLPDVVGQDQHSVAAYLYAKDANQDGLPDIPQEVVVSGTSFSTQYAVALAYLVQTAVPLETRNTLNPAEFDDRFVKALHILTSGKITPELINQDVIDELVQRIYY
ncbi:hypothetical protein K1X76_05875 [bacterium]|nr:hypothetical protein [bacterium]